MRLGDRWRWRRTNRSHGESDWPLIGLVVGAVVMGTLFVVIVSVAHQFGYTPAGRPGMTVK